MPRIDEFIGRVDYLAVTVKWKGLDFLRIIKCVDPVEGKLESEEDEDDESDFEVVSTRTEPNTSYHVQSLMDNFKFYWGKADTLAKAKELVPPAEKALVEFAYMIQTRRAP